MLLSCTSILHFTTHVVFVAINGKIWSFVSHVYLCLSCVCMCFVCAVVQMYAQNTQNKKIIGFVQVLVVCGESWLQLLRFVQIFACSYQGLSVQSFICGCKICANFGCGFCKVCAGFGWSCQNFLQILAAVMRILYWFWLQLWGLCRTIYVFNPKQIQLLSISGAKR